MKTIDQLTEWKDKIDYISFGCNEIANSSISFDSPGECWHIGYAPVTDFSRDDAYYALLDGGLQAYNFEMGRSV